MYYEVSGQRNAGTFYQLFTDLKDAMDKYYELIGNEFKDVKIINSLGKEIVLND